MRPALLFDLDGTLLHTDPLHAAVFQELFAERGRAIDEAYYLRHIHGRLNADIFSEAFPEEDAEALSHEKEARFRDKLGASAEPVAGLIELLDLCDAKGWGRALVTNAPRVNADAMLDAIGLRDRFETLIIGEECERGKPDPAPYLAAMQATGSGPKLSFAFEDSPSGMTAARASGAFTVGLRSSLNDAELRAAGAHMTIDTFDDPLLLTELDRRMTPTGAHS
ncbi:MAG: HAD-IA family hydrolase [Pseudomonadota bacterium]|nr:HAD-IA family hydrolase [Pseudomonadota bacterium]